MAEAKNPFEVTFPARDDCCVSPCEPAWLTDVQCMYFYEPKVIRIPLKLTESSANEVWNRYTLEIRVTYQHKLCLLGKQQGGLIYTVTLLPGEKLTLYHSDRYRQVTSVQDRFSIRTSFMTSTSNIHRANQTDTFDQLNSTLVSSKGSFSAGGGVSFFGLIDFKESGGVDVSGTNFGQLNTGRVHDDFRQSMDMSSQLIETERSIVVSTVTETDTQNISARLIQNDNACRAVTYFVRRVMELYAFSTTVTDISYRFVLPNGASDWRPVSDLDGLPKPVQDQIKKLVDQLPKIGEVTAKPLPISIPTDGTVYDPELAHCCSCEPEREAAIAIQLQKQKAEAVKLMLEVELQQAELQRRKALLQKGELAPFELTAAAVAPALPPP